MLKQTNTKLSQICFWTLRQVQMYLYEVENSIPSQKQFPQSPAEQPDNIHLAMATKPHQLIYFVIVIVYPPSHWDSLKEWLSNSYSSIYLKISKLKKKNHFFQNWKLHIFMFMVDVDSQCLLLKSRYIQVHCREKGLKSPLKLLSLCFTY